MVEAWRYWIVRPGNVLASPVTGDTLPRDGVHTARCDHHQQPPAEGCDCGIGYWPTKQDMQQAVVKLALMREANIFHRVAVTVGTAHGQILPDEFPPRWAARVVGGLTGPVMTLPQAMRCTTYRATAILTPRRSPFPYDVPVFRGTALDLLDAA